MGGTARSVYLCVHGHFYQPPQDPFTGRIPREHEAEPYANWNERIDAECYRPNAILGNFGRMSFDVGPTLFTWLAEADPATYRQIATADRGNAWAQAYNHTILPLMSRRDKETQVRWGMADFRHRFGREPEGLWLPETAVDLETLDVLAAEGIRYTILAPWQASVPDIDSGYPWLVRLPSDRQIAVFFFDALLSNNVSFNPKATESAVTFVRDYLIPWRIHRQQRGSRPPIILIASDGELYGHHQPGREHFLHDLLFGVAEARGFGVTSPRDYLALYPPREAVGIKEHSSWSCQHELSRWSSGCSCTEGDSSWKAILFEALTRLAERLDWAAAEGTRGVLGDVWAARDAYIGVLLGTTSPGDLLRELALRTLTTEQERRVLDLLESQYYRLAMFTSCGFFWEDMGRLEVRNDLKCAARAIELAEHATGARLAEPFAADLRKATSALTGENGEQMFYRLWAARGTAAA